MRAKQENQNLLREIEALKKRAAVAAQVVDEKIPTMAFTPSSSSSTALHGSYNINNNDTNHYHYHVDASTPKGNTAGDKKQSFSKSPIPHVVTTIKAESISAMNQITSTTS